MSTIAFVVPAYRRFELSRICLTHLAKTCDALRDEAGHEATAIVVGDDENLETAVALGFMTHRSPNQPLGRKWNDGIELAARQGFEYVVPFGTDNVVDPRLFLELGLPEPGRVRCHTLAALVDERGERLRRIRVDYEAGDGIRTYPTELFAPFGYRPADERRERAIDTSIRERLRRQRRRDERRLPAARDRGESTLWDRRDLHALQIVGFMSRDVQLNPYKGSAEQFGYGLEDWLPWRALEPVYGAELVSALRSHYHRHGGRKAA